MSEKASEASEIEFGSHCAACGQQRSVCGSQCKSGSHVTVAVGTVQNRQFLKSNRFVVKLCSFMHVIVTKLDVTTNSCFPGDEIKLPFNLVEEILLGDFFRTPLVLLRCLICRTAPSSLRDAKSRRQFRLRAERKLGINWVPSLSEPRQNMLVNENVGENNKIAVVTIIGQSSFSYLNSCILVISDLKLKTHFPLVWAQNQH